MKRLNLSVLIMQAVLTYLILVMGCSDQNIELKEYSSENGNVRIENTHNASINHTIKKSEEVDEVAHPLTNYDELIEVIAQHLLPSVDNQNMETTVVISFVINQTGNVEEARVVDGTYFTIDQQERQYLNQKAKEALLATSGLWKPALLDGRVVSSRLEIPVTFS